MKNPRAIAMLVISAVLGLLAAVMAANWLRQKSVSGDKIVVAAVDVQLGSRLNGQMLKLADWPAGSVPPGSFTDPKPLEDRVVTTSVLRGEPLLASKLAPIGTQGGLSAVIHPGDRAITVRVNDVIGVAGFALPGNYVDILVSTEKASDYANRDARQISKIVLQHILVLAVAQQSSRDSTKPRVVNAVTLEVTPEQAEKIDLARSIGKLSLVLRNQMDESRTDVAGVMRHQLLGPDQKPDPAPAAVAQAAPARRVVHVRRARVLQTAMRHNACVDVIKNGVSSTQCF